MIWTSWDDNGDVCYSTADNKKFSRVIDATNYISIKYKELKEQEKYYSILFERNRKLKVIMNKL